MSLFHTLRFIANHPLNRRKKSAAFLRFLKWQVRARLAAGSMEFQWIGNTRMLVQRGDMGFTQNIYCGLHDVAEMAYVLHAMTENDLFVDVGANLGSYTVLACGVKGSRGVCFEPVPSTYARLRDNLNLNNLQSRVTAYNLGLSDRDGELLFTDGESSTNHVVARSERSEKTISVPMRTLDSMLQRESPTMLKIDVEGFETPVLKGAGGVLGNPSLHTVLMELNGLGSRYGFEEDWIVNHMHEYGFSAFEYDPFARKLAVVAGKKSASSNTIFVRNSERMAEVLRNAPRIQVGDSWI
jgi:FkbM family methyltransferase